MLYAAAHGALEIRAGPDGSATVHGRFPYGSVAEFGHGRSETFGPRAFGQRIADGGEVHLLLGHDFNRPLASTRAGSLTLADGDDALAFRAIIPPDIAATSHGRDALAMIRGHLATGLSPGFVVPDGGADVTRDGDGLRRTVTRAELHELSIVARPAYEAAQVEARCWRPKRRNVPTFRRRRWL